MADVHHCGERVLLPAVRDAAKETLVIADGFSCREQIAQMTDRHALHPAQVIQMALHEGGSGPAGAYPEAPCLTQPAEGGRPAVGAAAGVVLAGAAMVWGLKWRRPR